MNIGKWLIFIGLGVLVLGVIVWAVTKMGVPFGKMPGDITVEKGHSIFYFPIVTSLVVSLILTILINVILWIFRK
jgi:heme/copper-type cytochrome/quinol oxidase subunit 2